MRRGIVLHLLARHELVFAGAPRRAAQAGLAHPAGQAAVGHLQTVVGQQFAHAHHVAASPLEGSLHHDQRRLVARPCRGEAWIRFTQDAPHGVARQRQQAADLAQAVPLRLQRAHRAADFSSESSPSPIAIVRTSIADHRRGTASISAVGTDCSAAARSVRRAMTASRQRRSTTHSPSGPSRSRAPARRSSFARRASRNRRGSPTMRSRTVCAACW